MKQNERLILAIGQIDEKYIKEAEGKVYTKTIVSVAAVLVVIISIGMFLFLPYPPITSNLGDYESSSYYPLIEEIEDYRLGFMQPRYNNNFEYIFAGFGSFLGDLMFGGLQMAPGDIGGGNMDSAPGMDEAGGNGSYVESTDNQVSGVIESDLMKMTDKYIFRLGMGYTTVEYEKGNETYTDTAQTTVLRVYSISKEDSLMVAEYEIPHFENEFFKSYYEGEMYLSLDGNTITVIKNYTDGETNKGKVGIISIDVSDVNNISTKAMVSIDGSLNTSRMVDGKFLLVSEFFFNRNKVDYSDPTTFVPSIDSGDGAKPIEFEDIIYPDQVTSTRYSVVALLDSENLELLGANALLNFTDEVYVSQNNVYITREYTAEQESDGKVLQSDMTDIAVLNYSGQSLEQRGIITVRGSIEDQYSFDEKDGYLRIVTSTLDRLVTDNGNTVSSTIVAENVSLWIYDLSDNSLAYSLEDFAIEGEEATAVRFDGDMVYVCTAVVVNFTDPVYFIDLSDYENIESADTGIIEGYSDHLINLGDGFLLGIGRENWSVAKVEIYEKQGDQVVSVDKFEFEGEYSTNYKAYLVNRENDLFGFGTNYMYIYDEQTDIYQNFSGYLLLQFNGYELTPVFIEIDGLRSDTVRAVYIDGYLYITTENSLEVEKIQ